MYKLLKYVLNEITLYGQRIRSFWVLPNLQILSVPNSQQHLDVLVKNPELFGVNQKRLNMAYKKYKGDGSIDSGISSYSVLKLATDQGAATITYCVLP